MDFLSSLDQPKDDHQPSTPTGCSGCLPSTFRDEYMRMSCLRYLRHPPIYFDLHHFQTWHVPPASLPTSISYPSALFPPCFLLDQVSWLPKHLQEFPVTFRIKLKALANQVGPTNPTLCLTISVSSGHLGQEAASSHLVLPLCLCFFLQQDNPY